jgi:hypothetical protein
MSSPRVPPTAILTLAALIVPHDVLAESMSECLAAFDQGQIARDKLKLQSARTLFQSCARAACPALLQKDCSERLEEVVKVMPSIVPGARSSTGDDIANAAIVVDGVPVHPDPGGAVPLDPGPHAVRFERDGFAPVTRDIVVRLGESNRPVIVTLASAAPPGDPSVRVAAPARHPSTSAWPWVFTGLGALGIGSFTFFAISGTNLRSDLLNTCAPSCRTADEDRLKARFIAADVSLAVGVVAAALATYLFLRPHSDPPKNGGILDAHFLARSTWK